jgi:hypothetical protein
MVLGQKESTEQGGCQGTSIEPTKKWKPLKFGVKAANVPEWGTKQE